MAYSKENIRLARETVAARRAAAIAEYEGKKAELSALIPELFAIEQTLSMTGAKIMGAALSHSLTDAALAEIKAENERLREAKALLLTAHGYPADALDIKYTCPKCSDTGYVGIDMCDCLRREMTLAGFASSGLSSLIEKQSFENFSLDYYSGADLAKITVNVKLLREFAENFDGKSGTSWLMLGGTGLGKTHLSTSVAKVVIESGYDVVYESAQGMISDFEARRFGGDFESGKEARYFDCDLLIIDDLGVEVANQFTVSCIYNIINTRVNKKKSTIINTNLTQNELRSRYADRITSRLFGEFRPLLFTGRDIRAQKLSK